MKRTPIALLTTAASAILVLLVPTSAPANHWSGWTPYEKHYLSVYVHCWKAFEADCGRNIVDDNLASGKKPSRAQVVASSERMTRWLNPPKPASVAVAPTVSAPTPTTTSVPSGGSGCSGMSAESGSAGYGAYNPSSGAAGCYQIIPSTAAAHGCDLSTPGGQDACAQAICATEGPGAWASSGANPC